MQEKKSHIVKVRLPETLHHAMRVILVSQQQTWEQWVVSMAQDTIDTIQKAEAQWRKGHSAIDRR